MATIDRILVPTDFSASAEKAYDFARIIAKAHGGVVDLLHIIPNIILLDEQVRNEKNLPDLEEDLYPHLFNEAELQIEKIMKEQFPYENRGNVYVKVDRKPSEVITGHALNGNYSMIIMSAKGKDQSGMFRGTTSEQVLRRSEVAVLTVTENANTDHIKRILLPSDGSLLSMAALPAAVKMAHTLGASITILYINEMYGLISNHFSTRSSQTRNSEIREHLISRLEEFTSETETSEQKLSVSKSGSRIEVTLRENGTKRTIPVQIEIKTGFSAHHEITEYANSKADMVVMTTHGRSGLAHLIMGSHAEKVAMNVEKPILTIRPDSKLFKKNKVETTADENEN
ncbi:universal stress protein [Rhodohalobacter sp. SW132]|uniref:universal stress protein n=1 Tax=Rhodohalobacter sp. SW132 TaxID=2293433 RepID=UPI000E2693E2|nr:universal stress protein [Rhodohalobacter sp. SW132]REL24047.1 universal stress protein [Rhodohalobacter sp. SW132]